VNNPFWELANGTPTTAFEADEIGARLQMTEFVERSVKAAAPGDKPHRRQRVGTTLGIGVAQLLLPTEGVDGTT
jgi:hypothetical protein